MLQVILVAPYAFSPATSLNATSPKDTCAATGGGGTFDQYCKSGAVNSSTCDTGCATSPASPMVVCCASSCCTNPGPPGPPPPPNPVYTCPSDPSGSVRTESSCLVTPHCGWCEDTDGGKGCIAGDLTGPFLLPAYLSNCKTQYSPGWYRGQGSVCLSIDSSASVQCDESCAAYGQSDGESFIVPSSSACQAYGAAYSKLNVDAATRKKVHEHVAGYLMQKGVAKAAAAAAAGNLTAIKPLDMTRQLIGKGLQDLEEDGLSTLETGACDYFTGDAFGFCQWGFTQDIESYVNDKILSIPLVQNVNNWLVNTADEFVPGGASNAIDAVAFAFGTSGIVDACESAGSAIVNGLFGWL